MQGATAQPLTSEEVNAKADTLGLNKPLGPGPLQTAPWNQLHALLPRLPSLDDASAPLAVDTDSLAGRMFNDR